MPSASPRKFPALSHPNFRLFWTGSVISLIGTLAQDAATGWLVRTLTPDPFVITLVAACNTFPILLLTVYAGAVADRVDKARGLFATNAIVMAFAVVLWYLVWGGHVAIWHVGAIALCVGTVRAFDVNFRQSMNIEMVGREDLPNAIALNSTAFNGARVLGPAIGGALIGWFGIAGCFLVNAISYLPLLWNLKRMKLPEIPRPSRRTSLADMREGFDWVRAHPVLAPVTTLIAVCSFFAFSFGNLFPIFAKDVFLSDARGFSLLLTCSGAGAVVAAGSLSISGNMRRKGKRVLGGALAFSLSVIGFALSPTLPIGCLFLLASGFFLLTCLMSANTLVQVAAPDHLRGRVFSFYSLALIGVQPMGAMWMGALAKSLGTREAVVLSSSLAAAWTLWTHLRHRIVWKER